MHTRMSCDRTASTRRILKEATRKHARRGEFLGTTKGAGGTFATRSPQLHCAMDDYEVLARESSELGEKLRGLRRLAEVERVNARLEEAALNTACLAEVSRHWDAVYDAMRRARID